MSEAIVQNVDEKVPPDTSEARVVPTTPLRRLYRDLQQANGSKGQRFEAIRSRLLGRHGPKAGKFVGELINRSRDQMARYNNCHEHFFQEGNRPKRIDSTSFANQLVKLLDLGGQIVIAGDAIQYLNYEISPLRTTLSCWESGKAANDSGAGGMDLLLIDKEFRPVIGEIKAITESVGATYSLIQALTYLSELATEHQWQRLRRFFPEFDKCQDKTPRMGIAVVFEAPFTLDDDFGFARSIAESLLQDQEVASYLSKIRFFSCQIENGLARFEEL